MNNDIKWRSATNAVFSWINTLDKIMQSCDLPSCDGQLVLLASDCSGFEYSSNYIVISILAIDLYNSEEWEKRRRFIRNKYLPNKRRMSFKTLNDKYRQIALIPFLEAADYIEGLLISFVINKHVKKLFSYPGILHEWHAKLGLKWTWSEKQFERMLKLANFTSILMGALGKDGQHMYWISDEDEIFANTTKQADVSMIMSRLGNIYIQHDPGELGIGTSAIDPGDRAEEDLVAIADLAAGAMVDVVGDASSNVNWHTSNSMSLIETTKAKSAPIISWLGNSDSRLKKVAIIFDESKISDFSLRKLYIRETSIII
jgi:hypothetical protein